jgi:hypothetical protein
VLVWEEGAVWLFSPSPVLTNVASWPNFRPVTQKQAQQNISWPEKMVAVIPLIFFQKVAEIVKTREGKHNILQNFISFS